MTEAERTTNAQTEASFGPVRAARTPWDDLFSSDVPYEQPPRQAVGFALQAGSSPAFGPPKASGAPPFSQVPPKAGQPPPTTQRASGMYTRGVQPQDQFKWDQYRRDKKEREERSKEQEARDEEREELLQGATAAAVQAFLGPTGTVSSESSLAATTDSQE